jgi:hypothetical protein
MERGKQWYQVVGSLLTIFVVEIVEGEIINRPTLETWKLRNVLSVSFNFTLNTHILATS